MASTNGQSNGHGELTRIVGPVVSARQLPGVAMYDVVRVGRAGLVGEVIRLDQENATIQVYEDTSGLRTGEPVVDTGGPLMVELGPGLLGSVFDGIQRPLDVLLAQQGPWMERAAVVPALSRTRRWQFTRQVAAGDEVGPGDVLGVIQETTHILHKLMTPPGLRGVIEEIHTGEYTVDATVATIRDNQGRVHPITMMQRWPVRVRRPYVRKLDPETPLLTGQRVIDTFFPIARGGTAIIPGGFGTGKTVTEQTLAKWADADIVVYIGCGERGNEMTEVLEEFPHLVDPRTGTPLMQRTILIANTSNMPVAAREASIYTGITIAEYYRDMGYDVALMADSTSRWGEALREVSGRLEEMPGAEGYPAYLATRLADFYERAGRVEALGTDRRVGSVTAIGAVSPPGADFSEPMTQNSLRVSGVFWALDAALARRRHFPAINWTQSYSLFDLRSWFAEQVTSDWPDQAKEALGLLQREAELVEIVQLVGEDGLPPVEKALLQATRLIREDFLQQRADSDVDAYCALPKQYWMLRAILTYYQLVTGALNAGSAWETIAAAPEIAEMGRMKEWPMPDAPERIRGLIERMEQRLLARR
jgi:V/A-type H+/Na+-transporting ATPase subunit A